MSSNAGDDSPSGRRSLSADASFSPEQDDNDLSGSTSLEASGGALFPLAHNSTTSNWSDSDISDHSSRINNNVRNLLNYPQDGASEIENIPLGRRTPSEGSRSMSMVSIGPHSSPPRALQEPDSPQSFNSSEFSTSSKLSPKEKELRSRYKEIHKQQQEDRKQYEEDRRRYEEDRKRLEEDGRHERKQRDEDRKTYEEDRKRLEEAVMHEREQRDEDRKRLEEEVKRERKEWDEEVRRERKEWDEKVRRARKDRDEEVRRERKERDEERKERDEERKERDEERKEFVERLDAERLKVERLTAERMHSESQLHEMERKFWEAGHRPFVGPGGGGPQAGEQ
ncbi:hypothetical protein BDZ89DRAFT_1079243 [Hymenopellis radicata]|nr:hypothetical protein BDZ89DRAFT_1079243 [Hymenopellis radicata]